MSKRKEKTPAEKAAPVTPSAQNYLPPDNPRLRFESQEAATESGSDTAEAAKQRAEAWRKSRRSQSDTNSSSTTPNTTETKDD